MRCLLCLSQLLSRHTLTQAFSEELKLAPGARLGGSGKDGWSCDCLSCWNAHLPVRLTQGGRAVKTALLLKCQDSKNNLCKIRLLKQRQNLLNHCFIYLFSGLCFVLNLVSIHWFRFKKVFTILYLYNCLR